MQIPQFSANGTLPAGIHLATFSEVEAKLGFNKRRQTLLKGLKQACEILKLAGCQRIYLNGSFSTNKPYPNDFDLCWDDQGVDLITLQKLEPIFFNFSNKRAAQKAKYGGEFFPANAQADEKGRTYLEFFQQDREGNPKGIIAIDL
jgi:hypothetical protein